MHWLPGPDTRAAVLKHPFFLAGLAVVVLLGLTAGTLVIVDSVRGSGEPERQVVVEPLGTNTPGPVSRTAVALGVSGRTVRVAAVRTAPGERSPRLGNIPRGSDVSIDGRTDDNGWYRIIFPPNSDLHGWVDADDLELTGDPRTLVVATAEPPIIVDVPTIPPAVLTADAEVPTIETPAPTETPVPGSELPDLVVGSPPNISEGQLFVTVINQGAGIFQGDLVVAIFNSDSTALLGGATIPGFTLEPGRSIDVGTGYVVSADQTLLLIVDPNGDVEEVDNTNNSLLVSITLGAEPTVGNPFDTPTPVPPPPPAQDPALPPPPPGQ
jgi:uncharacterized protein YraI